MVYFLSVFHLIPNLNILLVLKANNRSTGCQRIPESTFCLEINKAFLQADLQLWCSKRKVIKNDKQKTNFVLRITKKSQITDMFCYGLPVCDGSEIKENGF